MRTCAACGQENPAGFNFCGACGAPLREESPRELRKTVTVVFADVVGSTALAERSDPEAVRATMRRYFEELRSILERHGGTVEKFIGDAVMAVFGVPRAHEDDALRAVRAAAEMREAVDRLDLQARIGVNTGEVVAGDVETLATGDAVNVAARLEQNAEPGEILIGSETFRLVRDAVRVESVELSVKGKSEPVDAYRLLAIDPDAPGLARRLDSPLVGRQRELERLRQDFERASAESTCQLFTLLGSAGVGKSRLVAEFVAETGERARVVEGRCLHYGEGITYWPLVEVLLELELDPEPVLALPSPSEAAVATRKLLEQAAAKRPLLVVLDDLQWAEPAFLDLVEHVTDLSRGAPIFLLCVARPELLDARPGWGGGKLNSASVLLEPLGQEEAATLVDNLLGATQLPVASRRRIVEAADGNPLFVEEMLLMLDEWDGAPGEVTVPPTIHALLQARLDLLGEGERAVIERGAVEGKVFHRAPVAELSTPAARGDVDACLTGLVRKELIRPEPPTYPEDDAFRFRHLLIRDAAYESLPKETRAELHERFADWLDAHVDLVEQDEIVGYHLEQAVRYMRELDHDADPIAERATRRLSAAGRSALGRGDVHAGAGLLGRAAQLLPPGAESRLAALPSLVAALIDLGRFDEAGLLLDELASSDGERWRAYAAVLGPGHRVLTGTGSFEAEAEALAAAKQTFERLADAAGLAQALSAEGHHEWDRGRSAAAIAAYRAALPHAEAAGNSALVEELWRRLATALVMGPIPVDDAEPEIRAALEAARGVNAEAGARRALGRILAMRGDFEAARRLSREGREAIADAGYTVLAAAASQQQAMIELTAGDADANLRILVEGFERLDELGERSYASTNAARIARSLADEGRDAEAVRWVAVAREYGHRDDVFTMVEADSTEAMLLARGGRHEEAERLARDAVEQAESTDFWILRAAAHEALAEVLSAAGKPGDARAELEEALRIYEAKGNVVLASRLRELLQHPDLGPPD
jgi:class 3 adenylate cyclase/tetratricopeptide (TPR) repeat protein